MSCDAHAPGEAGKHLGDVREGGASRELLVGKERVQPIFARVVLVSEEPRLYRLEILTKDDVPPPAGVPVLPTVDGLLEFILGMANGDVKKGGDRDARAKDWYASPMNGLSQADISMPLDKEGPYGWGATRTSRSG